jgi:hypothetical protein
MDWYEWVAFLVVYVLVVGGLSWLAAGVTRWLPFPHTWGNLEL